MKKIILNFLLIILSFILSIIICMNSIDDILTLITTSLWVSMGARINITLIIYFFIKDLFNKKVESSQINILFIIYILFICSLTFLKGSYNNGTRSININPLNIIQDLENASNTILLIVGNYLAYVPIGMYFRYKYPHKRNCKLILLFLLVITSIEICQYVFNLGSYDINDIILNSMGFCSGVYILEFIFNKMKRKC